jgi:DNA uptake protein ComE-like DNA-binding protein
MLKHTAWILAAALAMALPAGAQTRPGTPAVSLIDLNSASQDDLMTLDGIGEVRAAAIIRARPFRTKGELVERRLIPEALYDKLADKVTVRPIPGTPPVPTTRPLSVPQQRKS